MRKRELFRVEGQTVESDLDAIRAILTALAIPDIAGHRAGMKGSIRSLERVDGFLGGVLQSFPREGGLVVTSDHGNIEEATGGHTRNPALGLFVGSAAHVAQRTRPASIMDVPGILGLPAETPDPPDYPAAPEGEPS